jgi:hypothetical protein
VQQLEHLFADQGGRAPRGLLCRLPNKCAWVYSFHVPRNLNAKQPPAQPERQLHGTAHPNKRTCAMRPISVAKCVPPLSVRRQG